MLGLTCHQTSAEECQDTNYDSLGVEILDYYHDSCSLYHGNEEHWCGSYDTESFLSEQMCCACGGGSTGANPDIGSTVEVCVDSNTGPNGETLDTYGYDCDYFNSNPAWCGWANSDTFNSNEMCCQCGGGERYMPETTSDPDAIGTGVCVDTNIGYNGAVLADNYGDNCDDYAENLEWCGEYNSSDFRSEVMCCACGGGNRGQGEEVEVEVNCECGCSDTACWQGCFTCLKEIFEADA